MTDDTQPPKTLELQHRKAPRFVSEHAHNALFYVRGPFTDLVFYRESVDISCERGTLREDGGYDLAIDNRDVAQFREDVAKISLSTEDFMSLIAASAEFFGYTLVPKDA